MLTRYRKGKLGTRMTPVINNRANARIAIKIAIRTDAEILFRIGCFP